ncbi:Hexosyltransferase [Sarracenia purpurea var. burkii]
MESPFSIMVHEMGQALPKASAVPINSFEELDPEINKELKSKLQNFLNVGPFNLMSQSPSSNLDEYGCIPWLDLRKTASVAYIGFGTVAIPTRNEEPLAESSFWTEKGADTCGFGGGSECEAVAGGRVWSGCEGCGVGAARVGALGTGA